MSEPKYKYCGNFEIGAHVIFDGHEDVVCRITAVKFRTNFYPEYCLEWIRNGALASAWFEEWRLVLV